MTAASPLYELRLERGTGRSFSVSSLGWVVAPSLAKPPKRGFERDRGAHAPVFLTLSAPSTTLDPFLRNFRDGADAFTSDTWPWHRLRLDPRVPLRERRAEIHGHTLYLAWHPAFEIEPERGADDEQIVLASMPQRRWLQEQSTRLADSEDPFLFARAAHVCALLARRTSTPIAPAPAFHLRLFETMPDEWRAHATKVGLEDHVDPVLVRAPRGELREWLRRQTGRYLERDAA